MTAYNNFDDFLNQPPRDDIAKLAYALWEQRGRGHGSDEQDWLNAEEQLRLQYDEWRLQPMRQQR